MEWKQAGKAIIFVSHRMEEIFRIADNFSVLRNGKTVGAGSIKDITENDLVALMVEGAVATNVVKRERRVSRQDDGTHPLRLEIKHLHTDVLAGIDLQLRDGELLGIGGLKGQGQRELLLALFGALPYQGEIKIAGETVKFKSPRQAMNKGIALVPGDRAKEGLLFIRSILENLFMPSWKNYGFPLKLGRAREDGHKIAGSLNLIMAGLDEPVSSLSGGNAQKVVIGKWLARSPKLLLLDDPTKGVDVGTKAEFYKLLAELGDQGTAILFYSSDDEELLGLCDRVLVMHDGLIHSELSEDTLTKSNLVAASLGITNGSIQ